MKFIIAVAVLKVKAALLDRNKLIPAREGTIGYRKSEGLNVIYKSGILSLIISACSWKQYS